MKAGEIGRLVGRARDSVRRTLARAGVAVRPGRPGRIAAEDMRERVRELHALGLGSSSIGRLVGRDASTVNGHIDRLGLSRTRVNRGSASRFKATPPEVVARIREMSAAGVSAYRIAREVGVSPETVYRKRAAPAAGHQNIS